MSTNISSAIKTEIKLHEVPEQMKEAINPSEKFSTLTSININAYTPGTAVLICSTTLAVTDLLLDYCWLLFDEILSLIEREKIIL